MKTDLEIRERLARAIDAFPVDIDRRLQAVHSGSRARRTARRIATGAVASAVAAAAVLSAFLLLPLEPREDGRPGVGPSGRIAYTRVTISGEDLEYEAYATTPGRWDRIPLLTGEDAVYAPVLSPDGSRIAFVRRVGDASNLWVAGSDGSGAHPLTGSPDSIGDSAPAWSPDGSEIAVIGYGRGGSAVWIVEADGSGARRVLREEGWKQLAWSPDGERLALAGFAETSNTVASYSLAVVAPDGTGLVRVAEFDGTAAYPTWSPDGSRIALMVLDPTDQGDYRYDVHIVNADGSRLTRLKGWEGFDGFPVWSPDGRWIAFSSDRSATADQLRLNRAGEGWFGASLHLMRPDGSGPYLVLEAGEASLLPTSWIP